MRHEQNAMEIQIRKPYILDVERLGMTKGQKRFMSQALLGEKYYYRHIYKERKWHASKWNSKRKGMKKIYDIFKNGTKAKVQGTLGKEA